MKNLHFPSYDGWPIVNTQTMAHPEPSSIPPTLSRRTRSRRGQTPMYQVLKADLKKEIQEGRLSVGQLVPSESELIAKYRVSSTTARRCLDELENEGLLERKRGAGTFVSGMASVLNKQRVAVVVKSYFSLAHPFLATVVGAIERTLEQAGAHMVIVKARFEKDGIGSDARLEDLLEHAGARHAFLLSNMPLRFVQPTLDQGIKCLGVNTRYLDPRVPSVISDFGAGFSMALSELAQRGHRRIGILMQELPMAQHGVMNSSSMFDETYAALRAVYPRLAETPLIRRVGIGEDVDFHVRDLIKQHPELTAFHCWDEIAGLEVMRALTVMGKRVPGQISVVGSRLLPASPVACVDVPLEQIGSVSAELMLGWIDGLKPENRIIQPAGFLVRETLADVP